MKAIYDTEKKAKWKLSAAVDNNGNVLAIITGTYERAWDRNQRDRFYVEDFRRHNPKYQDQDIHTEEINSGTIVSLSMKPDKFCFGRSATCYRYTDIESNYGYVMGSEGISDFFRAILDGRVQAIDGQFKGIFEFRKRGMEVYMYTVNQDTLDMLADLGIKEALEIRENQIIPQEVIGLEDIENMEDMEEVESSFLKV